MPPHVRGDMVVILHLLFILFVIFGGLLVLRRPRLAYLHIPAALWGALVELQGWTCPLTPLEYHYRQSGGQGPPPRAFIDHYLLALLYPPGLSRTGQIVLGLLVIAVNVAIYGLVVRRSRQKSGSGQRP